MASNSGQARERQITAPPTAAERGRLTPAATESHPVFLKLMEVACAEQERFQAKPFKDYFLGVLGKLDARKSAREALAKAPEDMATADRRRLEVEASYHPSPNAAEMLVRAITEPFPPVFDEQTGYTIYPFFTQPNGPDGLQVFGNAYEKQQLVAALEGQGRNGPASDRIIVLIGPTGGGKSTIVNKLEAGIEQYALTGQEPAFAIKGCPILEDPLHLLPMQVRAEISERYDVEITGHLCTDCTGKHGGKVSEVPVEPIHFSVPQRVGIGRLEANDTAATNPNAQENYQTALIRGNRGIVEVVEVLRHDTQFLRNLYELPRRRTVTVDGSEVNLDTVIIAHTTLNEWEDLQKTSGKDSALEQRFLPIYLRYPLSLTEEVQVYEARMAREREGVYKRHISPKALDVLAQVAVISRIKTSEMPGLDPETKMRVYNGETVVKQTTSLFGPGERIAYGPKQLAAIEAEGRLKREGLDGIPPTEMFKIIDAALTENPRCLNPIDALRVAREYIVRQPETTHQQREYRTAMLTNIDIFKRGYEVWLEERTRAAFRNVEGANFQTVFDEYIADVAAFAEVKPGEKPTRINRYTDQPEEITQRGMLELEALVEPPITTEEERTEFRTRVMAAVNSAAVHGVRTRSPQTLTFETATNLPDLQAAVERQVTGISDKDITDALSAYAFAQGDVTHLTDKIQEQIAIAKENLVRNEGMCPHCVDALLLHLATKVRSNQTTRR